MELSCNYLVVCKYSAKFLFYDFSKISVRISYALNIQSSFAYLREKEKWIAQKHMNKHHIQTKYSQ